MRDDAQPRKIQAPRALPSSPMTAAPTAGDALALVRLAASGAAGALARHASRIDDINVFPVPDGDTGANLSQTARSVLRRAAGELAARAVARSPASGARAALLGARGNSGIILSQLVRGACDRLGEGGPLDGPAVADALRRASTEADAALREPVEGTILTVARALADGAEAARSRRSDRDARGGARRRRGRARAHDRHAAVAARGRRRGRRAEPGWSSSCAARSPPCAASRWPTPRRSGSTQHEAIARRLRRAALLHRLPGRRRASRASSWSCELAPLGDCARRRLRRRARARARAHRRSRPRALGGHGARGALGRRDQRHVRAARRARRAPRRRGALEDDGRLADVLAIVDGDGNRVLYASLGARLLLGGRPTVDELRRRHPHEPGRRHRRCSPTTRGLQAVAEYAAQAVVGARARRALARARAGPRGARRLSHRSGRRRARGRRSRRRSPGRGSAEVPGGARRRRRRCARPSRARSRPAPRSSRCWPGRAPTARPWTRSRPGSRRRIPGVELELHDGGQAQPRYSVSAE